MPRTFPPFELQAEREVLAALSDRLAGYAVERCEGSALGAWLRSGTGQVWIVRVDQRDLEYKFEVFTLALETLEKVQARWVDWQPPTFVEEMPESIRHLLTTRPAEPSPSEDFIAWPFASWRTYVLRRAEMIVADADPGPTFGSNPVAQEAVPPGAVPAEASASCEVAVGLLFSGDDGRRLLMAVDWMPMHMVVTESAAEIDAYLEPCEQVSLAAYLDRFGASN